MKIKDIFELIKEDKTKYDEFFEELEEISTPELIEELEEVVLGNHFSPERLVEAYKGMENKDGSNGQHWSVDSTTAGAVQIGFNYKALGYNDCDWNFTVNMIYSDYFKPTRTVEDYLELAVDYLSDKDVQNGKIYRYYKRVIKDEC